MDVTLLDVEKINPIKQDIERAEGLSFHGSTFYGSGQPWVGDASRMAKLIKDPVKLVRRAKAVVNRWGTYYAPYYSSYYSRWMDGNPDWDCWTPFKKRLQEMGFTNEQISIIEGYKGQFKYQP